MKKLLLALLLLPFVSSAQTYLDENYLFTQDFWTSSYDNPKRVFNGINLYGGTNKFVEGVMPPSVITESELNAVVEELTDSDRTIVAGELNIYKNGWSVMRAVTADVSGNSGSELTFGTLATNVSETVSWSLTAQPTTTGQSLDVRNATGTATMRFEQNGITQIGDLKLSNTAVAETLSATHTLILRDGAGNLYKVLCVPVQ